MTSGTKTVALIVTYNRLNLLKECINALLNSKISVDILVVNNNSQDGTKEYLLNCKERYNDKMYVYNLNENLNGAGGYNFAIKEALKFDYKYLWIMDDDCIVNSDSLSELYIVKDELSDKFGFLASKVLWTDGSICKTNVQRKAVAKKIKNFTDHIVNVDYTSFVSCFVKSSSVRNIGLPIKEFVIWSDDLEWTRRLTNRKYNKLYEPGYLCNDSIATHKTANNFGVSIVKDTDERFPRYKYIYRNDVVCFKNEGISGHLYVFIRNIFHIILILLFAQTRKLERIKVLINGYIEGYRFNPKVEYV